MRPLLIPIVISIAFPAAAAAQEVAALRPPHGVRGTLGVGFLSYSEHLSGARTGGEPLDFTADLQPAAVANLDVPLARHEDRDILITAQVALTTQVDMKATQGSTTIQENQFHQEVVELGLRRRWRRKRSVVPGGVRETWFDVGYRGVLQRLHFVDVPFGTDTIDANETVQAHGLEVGYTVERRCPARWSALRASFTVNEGFADNDQIDGSSFHAAGIGSSIRGQMAWPAAGGWFLIGSFIDWRRQLGSGVNDVTIMGMQGQAIWPRNDTWVVLATAGLVLD